MAVASLLDSGAQQTNECLSLSFGGFRFFPPVVYPQPFTLAKLKKPESQLGAGVPADRASERQVRRAASNRSRY